LDGRKGKKVSQVGSAGSSDKEAKSLKCALRLWMDREMLSRAEDATGLEILPTKNKVLFLFLFAGGKVQTR
jgi:hypothetical protein